MREQESEIVKYVDLLIKRLHEECRQGEKKLNIEAWYNWTTFDIVGDLVFGQSFNCLQKASYHPWIDFIFRSIKAGAVTVSMTYVGLADLVQVLFKLGSFSITKVRKYTDDMLRSRLSMETSRDDLFEGLVRRRSDWVSDKSTQLISLTHWSLVEFVI